MIVQNTPAWPPGPVLLSTSLVEARPLAVPDSALAEISAADRPPADVVALAEGKEHQSLLARAGGVVLDGVRAAGDFVDSHPLLHSSTHATFALFRSLKAFPKFIYPTIQGATPAEKAFILQTLDHLPLKDVNTVKSLLVVPTIPHASGLAIEAQVTNVIKLARDQISTHSDWFREVVVHEVGHTKDFDSAWFGMLHHNSSQEPWGQGPFVSEYAKTNHWEDYAEAHANYHLWPERLQQAAPGKFAEMAREERPGIIERLTDQPAFRETGKFIGDNLGTDVSRTAVQSLYWASSGIQLVVGLDHLRAATLQKDGGKHFDGVLTLAAATLFASKVAAVGGLAVHGANLALQQAVRREDITVDDADAAVRVLSDPIEKAVRAVGHGVGLTASFEESLPGKPVEEPRRLVAASIAAGGSVGALVGGIAGPYLGIMGGYAIGGPIGGTVGLVLGGLAGYTTGSSVGGRIGGAIGKAIEHAAAE